MLSLLREDITSLWELLRGKKKIVNIITASPDILEINIFLNQ